MKITIKIKAFTHPQININKYQLSKENQARWK